jgi:hypothetical protein
MISNPNDDKWIAQCLRGLHKKAFIDSIFNMVYSGKAAVYNQETNKKLAVRQVHTIENKAGFSRDQVSMIQFTEAWYLNAGDQRMTKKVLSMVLGYNVYTPEGELIGPKPIFRIDLK